MSRGLRGRLTRDWKYLGLVIKWVCQVHIPGNVRRVTKFIGS
jgi:hypothetical protein